LFEAGKSEEKKKRSLGIYLKREGGRVDDEFELPGRDIRRENQISLDVNYSNSIATIQNSPVLLIWGDNIRGGPCREEK